MRFFWPKELNPEPSILVRFGRVIHWIALGIAMLLTAGGLSTLFLAVVAYQDHGYLHYSASGYLGGTLAFGAVALLVYLAGRALRYIFSGE